MTLHTYTRFFFAIVGGILLQSAYTKTAAKAEASITFPKAAAKTAARSPQTPHGQLALFAHVIENPHLPIVFDAHHRNANLPKLFVSPKKGISAGYSATTMRPMPDGARGQLYWQEQKPKNARSVLVPEDSPNASREPSPLAASARAATPIVTPAAAALPDTPPTGTEGPITRKHRHMARDAQRALSLVRRANAIDEARARRAGTPVAAQPLTPAAAPSPFALEVNDRSFTAAELAAFQAAMGARVMTASPAISSRDPYSRARAFEPNTPSSTDSSPRVFPGSRNASPDAFRRAVDADDTQGAGSK